MPVPYVRQAAAADAEAVSRLFGELGYPASADDVANRLAQIGGSEADHALVAVIEPEVAGLVSLNVAPLLAEGGAVGRITSLVVAERHRGTGVGRSLIEAAEQLARRMRCTIMRVSSGRRPERDAAHRLYRRLGYADAATHHVLYEKRLPPPTSGTDARDRHLAAGSPDELGGVRARAGWSTAAAEALRLRPLREDDEASFIAAQRQMAAADQFTFGFGYREGMPWREYLGLLEAQRLGRDRRDGWVPTTFLAADVNGVIVGRTSIRHRLNDFLRVEGGHIGYGVLVEHRRRGYATEILRQSLIVARSIGVDRVLVTCDETNAASSVVIERCGGTLDSVVETTGGVRTRRYWFD